MGSLSSSNYVTVLIVHVICGLYRKGIFLPPAQAEFDATDGSPSTTSCYSKDDESGVL